MTAGAMFPDGSFADIVYVSARGFQSPLIPIFIDDFSAIVVPVHELFAEVLFMLQFAMNG